MKHKLIWDAISKLEDRVKELEEYNPEFTKEVGDWTVTATVKEKPIYDTYNMTHYDSDGNIIPPKPLIDYDKLLKELLDYYDLEGIKTQLRKKWQ